MPRWYAIWSTVAFLFGAGLMALGIAVGWFLPFLGAMILMANVIAFPLLLVSWRAQGVVPRAGRLASSRYWRVAPIIVPLSLILGFLAFALPNPLVWVMAAVVIPMAGEHVYRLRAWASR